MIISNSAIQHIVSKAVAHTNLDTSDKDAFANAAMTTAPVAPVSTSTDTSAQSGTQGQQTYDEAFAKMMINLKAAMAGSTEDAINPQTAASMVAGADKQLATTDSVATGTSSSMDALAASANQDSASQGVGSAKDDLLDYMSQTAAEKARQLLTGVSKDQYQAMTPEEQASVDKKVVEVTQQKAETAQQEIAAKIAMVKAEMV
ncbi:hypothetical protein [Pseudomonas huanghezhanensis]|uniref:hypothetical protein n=1 Tax=Pseudomonas huanghezhanensis TaxID=3002903 RepID=UPI002285C13A|nr:hypothetical protein [Pseudomonas sp. BSw22131]